MTRNPITGGYEIAKVGRPVSNSYDWDDGNSTGYELNGVCALNVSTWPDLVSSIDWALDEICQYDDHSQVVLIGSLHADSGSDNGEIIMRGNDTVLAIIRGQQ